MEMVAGGGGGGKGGDGGIGVGGMSRAPSPTEIVRNEEGELGGKKWKWCERRVKVGGGGEG